MAQHLFLMLTSFIFTSVVALQSYQSQIPNGNNVQYGGQSWPAVGHTTPSSDSNHALNPFGSDFDSAGYKWTVALCQKDSDGDGMTNGQELGDPNCVWTVGATPTRTVNISHPGFVEGTTNSGTSQSPSGAVTGHPLTSSAILLLAAATVTLAWIFE